MGGVLLADNVALAPVPLTVTDYASLKEAVGNATEPTEITLEGTIADDASGQLYVEGKEFTLKGATLQSTGTKHLGLDVQSDGVFSKMKNHKEFRSAEIIFSFSPLPVVLRRSKGIRYLYKI